MKNLIFLTAIALIGIATSCKSTNANTTTDNATNEKAKTEKPMNDDNELKDIQLTEIERQLVSSNNDFAFKLFRAIKDDESKLVSPLSITYALGMLNNGAVGETQQEINKVLGFGNADVDAINNFCLKMLKECPNLDNDTKVLIANTIYLNKGYNLKKDFVKKAKKYYYAEPETRNFGDGKTLDVINKWANDHTEGMIPKILTQDEFDPAMVSYLLNALYFKGVWTDKFSESRTREELFNEKDEVMMMRMEKKFRYSDNDVFQSIDLPYGNRAYSMTVLLPHRGKTVDDVLMSLSGKKWAETRNGMRTTLVDLKLPRFETKSDIDLKKIMSNLGMPLAFTGRANFNEFCDAPTHIGLMKQVAKIKLDEKGTEAAAVTVIGMMKTSAVARPEKPIEFYADRDFVYVITEQSTGAIFFIGEFKGK